MERPIFLHQMQREWQASLVAAGIQERKSFEKNYLEMNFLSLTTLIARDRNRLPIELHMPWLTLIRHRDWRDLWSCDEDEINNLVVGEHQLGI
jgi:hypothetical protein